MVPFCTKFFKSIIKSMVLVKDPGIENTQIKHQALTCTAEQRGGQNILYITLLNITKLYSLHCIKCLGKSFRINLIIRMYVISDEPVFHDNNFDTRNL